MTSLKTKAQLCWNIVRGRPTLYRFHIQGTVIADGPPGGMYVDGLVESSPDVNTLRKIIIDHHAAGERIVGTKCEYCPLDLNGMLLPLVYVSTK